MKSPFLEVRESYQEDAAHPLVAELRELRERHDLMGCVLITFDGAKCQVGINTSGFDGEFAAVMDRLGQIILGAIDDGKFDSVLIEPKGNA